MAMNQLLATLEEESEWLQRHPLFELVGRPWPAPAIAELLRGITMFVFTFQDLVLLNERRIASDPVREFARRRRIEDEGHSLWFLKDLESLARPPDVASLFGEHVATRETSYELLSEVFRATSDHARIAIPLALEASGAVFFRNMYEVVSKAGLETRFFSRTHWEVETQHEQLSEGELGALEGIDWAEGYIEEAKVVIRRMFRAKARMLTPLREGVLLALASGLPG